MGSCTGCINNSIKALNIVENAIDPNELYSSRNGSQENVPKINSNIAYQNTIVSNHPLANYRFPRILSE